MAAAGAGAAAAGESLSSAAPQDLAAARNKEKLFGMELGSLKKVVPLGLMFFFVLFCYTILRNTKDVLVITAPGAGAETLPFIKLWVNLPASMLFMAAYSKMSSSLTRPQLFYACVAPFLAFFGAFAFVIYPNASWLHPHGLADQLLATLGPRFAAPISILRNWSFCLFYVLSELWGSVVVSLTFWSYASQVRGRGGGGAGGARRDCRSSRRPKTFCASPPRA